MDVNSSQGEMLPWRPMHTLDTGRKRARPISRRRDYKSKMTMKRMIGSALMVCLAASLATAEESSLRIPDVTESAEFQKRARFADINYPLDPNPQRLSPPERRSLTRLLDYSDPRTEAISTRTNIRGANEPAEVREFNILALGGSITWGAQLEDRRRVYPNVVGQLYKSKYDGEMKVTVDNLAIRATGSDYPKMCLQSMLREMADGPEDKSYDLILLDFILNGTKGFNALVQRLRRRYPDAEIVLVELWSLKAGAIHDVDNPRINPANSNYDMNRNWTWAEHMYYTDDYLQANEDILTAVGGHSFRLPRVPSVRTVLDNGWFASDWHHLSEHGHQLLAVSLYHRLLQDLEAPLKENKRVIPWGVQDDGDMCYNWFLNGEINIDYVGGDVASMAGGTKSYLEIDYDMPMLDGSRPGRSIMKFESEFENPVQLYVGYMSRQFPAKYPRVDAVLNHASQPSRIFANQNTLPFNATAHVTTYQMVGFALPGTNVLELSPLEHTEEPFRMIGVYLCATCQNFAVEEELWLKNDLAKRRNQTAATTPEAPSTETPIDATAQKAALPREETAGA